VSAAELVQRSETVQRDGIAAFEHAASLEELAQAERAFLGKGSPLNEVREAI
jgi:hypothetical protein